MGLDDLKFPVGKEGDFPPTPPPISTEKYWNWSLKQTRWFISMNRLRYNLRINPPIGEQFRL